MTYHAVYTASIGNRWQNEFIRNAGLGVDGVFHKEQLIVDWKEGEEVSEERAERLCDVLKDGLNALADTECSSVELVRVYAI